MSSRLYKQHFRWGKFCRWFYYTRITLHVSEGKWQLIMKVSLHTTKTTAMEQQNNALLLSTHQQVSTYPLSCAILSDWSCLKSARQPRSFCHFLCSMCQCVHSHIHWLSLRISFYKYLIATQNQWLLMALSMISALCATIWLIDNDVSVKCALTVACMPYIHIYTRYSYIVSAYIS